jgi:hypothetical protein
VQDAIRDLPVYLSRLDVQVAINAHGIYPSLNAIGSGIAETANFEFSKTDSGEFQIAIEAVMMDGSVGTITGPLVIQCGTPVLLSG